MASLFLALTPEEEEIGEPEEEEISQAVPRELHF